MRPKYEDKELRKAMLYAIDREKWIKAFFNGYASEINSFAIKKIIGCLFADPKELNDYKYDPEKAKKILDKLGYKDRDGDGFREKILKVINLRLTLNIIQVQILLLNQGACG